MPVYEYVCTACGHPVEVMHSFTAQGPQACERCGAPMRKTLSTPAIVFKGSGWAKKDHRDKVHASSKATPRTAAPASAASGTATASAAAAPTSDGGAAGTAGSRRRRRHDRDGQSRHAGTPASAPRRQGAVDERRLIGVGGSIARTSQELMARPGLSIRERLGAIERRARRFPPVRALMTINDAYNAAGGGLLASGPGVLGPVRGHPGSAAGISVLVLFAVDKDTQERFIDWITTQVPPLANVAAEIVNGVKDSARVGTVIGLVGFVWGASGFYLALENALGRFFPSRRGRDPIMGRIRSIVAVLLVVGGVLAAFGVNVMLSLFVGDGVVALTSPHRHHRGGVADLPRLLPTGSGGAAAVAGCGPGGAARGCLHRRPDLSVRTHRSVALRRPAGPGRTRRPCSSPSSGSDTSSRRCCMARRTRGCGTTGSG